MNKNSQHWFYLHGIPSRSPKGADSSLFNCQRSVSSLAPPMTCKRRYHIKAKIYIFVSWIIFLIPALVNMYASGLRMASNLFLKLDKLICLHFYCRVRNIPGDLFSYCDYRLPGCYCHQVINDCGCVCRIRYFTVFIGTNFNKRVPYTGGISKKMWKNWNKTRKCLRICRGKSVNTPYTRFHVCNNCNLCERKFYVVKLRLN